MTSAQIKQKRDEILGRIILQQPKFLFLAIFWAFNSFLFFHSITSHLHHPKGNSFDSSNRSPHLHTSHQHLSITFHGRSRHSFAIMYSDMKRRNPIGAPPNSRFENDYGHQDDYKGQHHHQGGMHPDHYAPNPLKPAFQQHHPSYHRDHPSHHGYYRREYSSNKVRELGSCVGCTFGICVALCRLLLFCCSRPDLVAMSMMDHMLFPLNAVMCLAIFGKLQKSDA